MSGPLERIYGQYRLTFRKSEHLNGHATPHIEVWKGRRKIGNYDMASGKPLPGSKPVHQSVQVFLKDYLTDNQVQRKIAEAIRSSLFDLHKVAGDYGAIPKGFKVTVNVEIVETDIQS